MNTFENHNIGNAQEYYPLTIRNYGWSNTVDITARNIHDGGVTEITLTYKEVKKLIKALKGAIKGEK